MITTEQINKKYFSDNIKTLNHYDKAIIGVDVTIKKVCYSITKMIDLYMEEIEPISTFDEAVLNVKSLVRECGTDFIFVDDIF
jgi:hypothetical protein